MNKLTRLMLVLVFLLSATGLAPVSSPAVARAAAPGAAQATPAGPIGDDQPPNPVLPSAPNQLYLPLLVNQNQHAGFAVHGKVTDTGGQPIAGVTITSDTGANTTTNTNGEYTIGVKSGQASLAPSKSGFLFTPSMLELNVSGNLNNEDFTAVADCSEAIVNGGFESTSWWSIVSSGYPAAYTNLLAHSGARSMQTGITNSLNNQLTESRVRTQLITIPSTATTATLRVWLYPTTSESPLVAIEKSGMAQAPAPVVSPFGDTTLLYDAQYVRVLDTSDAVIGTLLYIRSNNAYWSLHEFDLMPFAGRTVKIEIGAYNDGTDGVTALYADDVSLNICASSPPPPPPPVTETCSNQVANSGFEYNGSWNLPSTPYPAGYSYDAAHTGSRSMRTGIPLYTYSNVYAYSDAWQTVYIPPGASNARLKIWLYPRSEEVYASSGADKDVQTLAPNAPKEGAVWNDQALAPDSPDTQYLLLLNPYTQAIVRTLEWWSPRNAGGWLYREYDLSVYAGQYLRIQFGTFNNGYGGRSVMYVDDLLVNICTTPPPPPTCSERVSNGGFEYNSSWYIPYTAFSAGYSYFLKHTGARSMRTGILDWYFNRYSYSDFRQTVTIPSGSGNATLRFYAYPISGEVYANTPESKSPTAGPAEAMAGDVQYLLVLDRWGNWIDTLVWMRSNQQYWRYFTFNLNRYIGQTIMLQWGAFNNGYSGVTSMYVDDVSLQACP